MKRKLLHLLMAIIVTGNFIQAQSKKLPPIKELPGGPENTACILNTGKNNKSVSLTYDGMKIFESEFDNAADVTSNVNGNEAIAQEIIFYFEKETTIRAVVHGSSEALAAETRGKAQEEFAMVRTTHGLSNNLRNNAVYDRRFDWMIEAPEGTVIKSFRNIDGTTRFELTFKAKQAKLVFRPGYYRKHKNLPYFEPWTYRVYKQSVTGWSSWWAYFREFNEKGLKELLDIWQEKHFADYGYRFIQIDDVYQGGNDEGRKNCSLSSGYLGGRPTTWLDWKKDLFPGGLTGYVNSVNHAGFSPAVWMGCFFSDEETVKQHPDWFIQDDSDKPSAAPWVSYAMDATNKETVEALIRPTFKGFKDAGVEYVKIDQLRHYLYDNMHNNLDWFVKKGLRPDEMLRAYLTIAREELGDETFILSCWGVLPESIGIADACRIGGDGYGPVTMQQYNSWNGIVWRNDPDHCDVLPSKRAKDVGNVKNTEKTKAVHKESIIRPALASMAGTMLMLSDKPEVYKDDRNLFGLRRSSPVLFSVPGQLYDYDPVKTDKVMEMKRTDIRSGKHPTPIDADQFGEVCPYWLNEFGMSYEDWYVFNRLNWDKKKKLDEVTINFADLGLDPGKEYLIYEFWGDKFLGIHKGSFKLGKLEPYGLESLAIREKLDRPQVVSTNRHFSQGAAEIEKLIWANNAIKGRSRVVIDDKYMITFYIPDGYKLKSATINGQGAKTEQKGNVLKMSYLPSQTASVRWEVSFEKK